MSNFPREQSTATSRAGIGSGSSEESSISAANNQQYIDAKKALLDIANGSDATSSLKWCLQNVDALVERYEVRPHLNTHDLTDGSTPGIQTHPRLPRRPHPMVHQIEGHYREAHFSPRRQGKGET